MADVLGTRALNRALLARQHLLARRTGRVTGTWTAQADGTPTVTAPLTTAERADVQDEGARLAAFLGDGTPAEVRMATR